MIRSAAGEKLPLEQKRREARTAGRSRRASMPKIPIAAFCRRPDGSSRYRPPPEGKRGDVTVRNDTGVYEGGEISIYLRSDDRQALHPCADARARRSTRWARRSTNSASKASTTTSHFLDRDHAQPALPRGPADDGLHRRGISRRLPRAPLDDASNAPLRRGGGCGEDHAHAARRRASPARSTARTSRGDEFIVTLGRRAHHAVTDAHLDAGSAAHGASTASRYARKSTGVPASP